MADHLKEAQSKLSLQNIFIKDCSFMAEDNLLKITNNTKYKKQGYNGVTELEESIVEDNTGKKHLVYTFFYKVGFRIVDDASKDDVDEKQSSIKLEIAANFAAIYSAKEKLTHEELDAFSIENVQFNVWPYWRELVQSTCLRMGQHPITVPLFKTNSNI